MTTPPTALIHASGTPNFNLHTLGWSAFQSLCGTVLREVFGQSVQTFADSNDAGRDGAFHGAWDPAESGAIDLPSGSFVLQCKHTKRADSTMSLSTLTEEFSKVKALVARGACNSYILMSNARLTGRSEEAIQNRLEQLGVKQSLILGSQWISDVIASNRKLRMLVPRVYGLGDLSQILDERAYAQARTLMDYLHEDLRTFVVTNAYERAAAALDDHGFVLLLGQPATGKSTIASTLSMAAMDRWGSVPIRASQPADFLRHWNPDVPNQLFWVDDAFGAVRHQLELTATWNRELPMLMAAVKRGTKVILTSRDYIYMEARPLLKEPSHPLLMEQKVVIDVTAMTDSEKAQILYNHISMGDQPLAFKQQIKRHLDSCAKAQSFHPEAARRLGQKRFTKSLDPSDRETVIEFVTRPASLLAEVYDQLDDEDIAALALVYSSGDRLTASAQLDALQLDLISQFGGTPAGVAKALMRLNGTFLRFAVPPGSTARWARWSFHHPTLQEGFAAFLIQRPHALPQLINGIGLDELFTRLDCGVRTATFDGVIRVPLALFPAVSSRLETLMGQVSNQAWATFSAWCAFLGRGSDSFLRVYFHHDPNTIHRAAGLLESERMDGSLTADLIARLHSLSVLQPDHYETVRTSLAHNILIFGDSSFLDVEPWHSIAELAGRARLLDIVATGLYGSLKDVLDRWRSWWTSQVSDPYVDVDSHFSPLLDTLARLELSLPGDPALDYAISAARDEVMHWISIAKDERDDPSQYVDDFADYDVDADEARPTFSQGFEGSMPAPKMPQRSIFEDIDD